MKPRPLGPPCRFNFALDNIALFFLFLFLLLLLRRLTAADLEAVLFSLDCFKAVVHFDVNFDLSVILHSDAFGLFSFHYFTRLIILLLLLVIIAVQGGSYDRG